MNSPSEPPARPASPTPPRRGWLGRLAPVALAALAVLLVLAALAPTLLSGYAAGLVERAFARRFQGRLEVGGLDLAWTGRQRLREARLTDPEGSEVARVSAELPGLLAIARGRGKRLGTIRASARAQIVAGDDGRTNLDRALAPRGEKGERPRPERPEPGSSQALEELALELDLALELLRFEDANTRAVGAPFELSDAVVHLSVAPGGSLSARAEGAMSGAAGGTLRLSAEIEHAFAPASDPAPPRLQADVHVAGLPAALLDNLARQGGLLTELLGQSVTIDLRASGTPQEGELELELSAERARVDLSAALSGGVLRAGEGAALEVSLAPAPGLLARVPSGATLSRPEPDAPLRLSVVRLELPLAAAIDARAAGQDALAALLSGAELELEAELGAWSLSAPGGLKSAEPVRVEGLQASARIAVEGQASRGEVELRARLGPQPGAPFSARASAQDVRALFAALRGPGEAALAAEVALAELPLALVEPLLPNPSGVRATLGDRLKLDARADATLSGTAPERRVAAKVELSVGGRERALVLSLEGSGPLPAKGGPSAGLPAFEARGTARGLEVVQALAPEVLRPALQDLLGNEVAFEVRSSPRSPGVSSVALSLSGAGTEVALAGDLDEKAFVARAEPAGITLSARPSDALIGRFVGPSLPRGAELDLAEEPLRLRVRELELPLAFQLDRLRAKAELALPALTYRQAAGEGAGPLSVELSGLRAEAALAPETGLALRVTGSVGGGAPDAIELDLRAERPAELLAGTPSSPALVEARARGLPTALIDALAAQKGLLVDVLGPTLDLELAGRFPDPGTPLRAVLSSESARVELSAALDSGTRVASGEQGLKARSPLTPLYSQRIVGALLPLLVGLSQPEGAPPVALSVSDFRLPLDGDPKKLSARIDLDLHQVSYEILPGLSELLQRSGGSDERPRVIELQPLSFAIQAGIVRYDGLPLKLGGHDLAFRGSFDLSTR